MANPNGKKGSPTGRCYVCDGKIDKDSQGRNIRKYCSIECLNEHRRRRYAQNPRPAKSRPTLEDRFWSRVNKDGPVHDRLGTRCWDWMGSRHSFGYGFIGVGDHKTDVTHRVSWRLVYGSPPEGLVVRHRCDRPICVNPAHLELGTHADNSQDRVERGRLIIGEQHPSARLSDDDVREIRARRAAGEPRRSVAERFGVTTQHITDITRRKERKHVK